MHAQCMKICHSFLLTSLINITVHQVSQSAAVNIGLSTLSNSALVCLSSFLQFPYQGLLLWWLFLTLWSKISRWKTCMQSMTLNPAQLIMYNLSISQGIVMGLAYASTGVFRSFTPIYRELHSYSYSLALAIKLNTLQPSVMLVWLLGTADSKERCT